MKTKAQIEEKIEELQNFLDKNKREIITAERVKDFEKTMHFNLMIKILENEIELLKWVLN